MPKKGKDSSDDLVAAVEEITLRVKLNYKKQHSSGLEVELRDDGYYYVSAVPRNCKSLGVGDRVLEINGTGWKNFTGEANANAMIDTMILGFVPGDDDDDDSDDSKNGVPVSPHTSSSVTKPRTGSIKLGSTNSNPSSPVSKSPRSSVSRSSIAKIGNSPGKGKSPRSVGNSPGGKSPSSSANRRAGSRKISRNGNTNGTGSPRSSTSKKIPYFYDSDDSSEEPEKPSSFRRRSAMEEEARQIAAERVAAKKKASAEQQQTQEDSDDDLDDDEEPQLQKSPQPQPQSASSSPATKRRPSAASATKVSPSPLSGSRRGVLSNTNNNGNPNNDFVSPSGRVKKRTSLRDSNIGLYSPIRADGWTKVKADHKSNG